MENSTTIKALQACTGNPDCKAVYNSCANSTRFYLCNKSDSLVSPFWCNSTLYVKGK